MATKPVLELDKTKPAVAAGGGKFIKQDFGKQITGLSSMPTGRIPGVIGLPTGIDEDLARAIEVHEYLHLSINNRFPNAEKLSHLFRAGPPENEIAYQTIMDMFVNRQANAIPELQPIIQHIQPGYGTVETIKDLIEGTEKGSYTPAQILGCLLQLHSTDTMLDVLNGSLRQFASIKGDSDKTFRQLSNYQSIAYKITSLATNTIDQFDTKGPLSSVTADKILDIVKAMTEDPEVVERTVRYLSKMDKKERMLASYMVTSGQLFNLELQRERQSKSDHPEVAEGDMVIDASTLSDVYRSAENRYSSSGDVKWGKMRLNFPYLSIVHDEEMMRKSKPRYSFSGPFKYPSRALLPAADGSAFAVKRRTKGGVLLIDISGSMCLSDEQVGHIIDMLPACTIAMYSGDKVSSKTGVLSVLADRGRKVKSVHEVRSEQHSGGNVVDLPALVWLSQQQLRPHIWISDGHVTGEYDKQGRGMVEECRGFVRKHGIINISSIPDTETWIKENPQYFVH